MRFFSIALLFFAASVPVKAEEIKINEAFRHELIGKKYLEIAEDKTKSITFAEAIKLNYKPYNSDIPNFGFDNSSFWLRFYVTNNSFNSLHEIIEIKNPNLDIIKLIKIDGIDTAFYESGDYFPWKNRVIDNKYFQFNIEVPPQKTLTLYLNLQNSGEQFHAPLHIGTPDYFKEEEINELIFFGLYFGMVIFALLLNLFFFFALKDNHLLYYIAYLAALLGLQLSFTGIGYKYFWPESVFMANHANPIFASLSVFFLLHFCIHFLKIKHYLPKIKKVYSGLSYLMIPAIIFAWIPNNVFYTTSVISINVITLILNILIPPTCIYIWHKKFKPARFFTIAFIVLMASVFVFILRNFGVISPNFFTDYGLQAGSGVEVLLLTLAVIDRFKQFKDQALNNLEEVNRLKTEANIILEKKVKERTTEIEKQKIEIELKNDEILSSVRYARRIQTATLPPKAFMDELFKEYFIYYNPRDIVSGDFYWAGKSFSPNSQTKLIYLALADCTGHGIPGAFLSLIGNNFLKQSLVNEGIFQPAQILDFLNTNIIKTLNQGQPGNLVRDGMDIALLSVNYEKMEIQFAGANNPVYLVRDNKLEVFKADKQPIGSMDRHIKNFTNTVIPFQEGDRIYMFSDGYADQMGGEKGKKFMYKSFKEYILGISDLSMDEQGRSMEEKFKEWKGPYEQIDDVCVMGIKL